MSDAVVTDRVRNDADMGAIINRCANATSSSQVPVRPYVPLRCKRATRTASKE